MPRLLTLLLFVILWMQFCDLKSQTQNHKYTFRHLTTKDGLPSNKINSLIKDDEGFMWFGTDNGLVRYDGYNCKTYQLPTDTLSDFNSQVVYTLFEDKTGILWLGIYGQGLRKFCKEDESFTDPILNTNDPNSLSNNFVNVIFQDSKNDLWIGTNDGLNKYVSANNSFETYKQKLKATNDLNNRVYSISEDKLGFLWIGTGDGVHLFDWQNKSFTKFDIGKEIPGDDYRKVNCIFEDRNGILWFGTEWGLFRYDKNKKEIKNYLPEGFGQQQTNLQPKSFISNIFVKSIIETEFKGKHLLWIATRWGLNIFETGSEQFTAIHNNQRGPQSLSTNSLEKLLLDNNGLLWISTSTSGLEILNTRPNPFHEFLLKIPGQDYHYQANSFLVDKSEDFWVGAFDIGLLHYTKTFNYIDNYAKWQLGVNTFDERQHNLIHCIYEDDDNNLWLGFYKWGLVKFNYDSKTFNQIELINYSDAPKPDRIDNIIRDHEGILWVGSYAGLYMKDENDTIDSPVPIIEHPVLKYAEIISLFEDKGKNLWISTRKRGLYCLKPENRSTMIFDHYMDSAKNKNEFFGNYVTSICEDQQGTLWFGSDKGLNTFNFTNNNFEPDTNFNKDHAGHIIKLYCDVNNNLWLLQSPNGLIRYQPKNDNKVKVFDISDGLPFDNFNTLYYPPNAFYQSNDGRLFISAALGTNGSFLWFHPDSISDNNNIPKIVVTGFRLRHNENLIDSSITVKKRITLEYDQNFFAFEFVALDFLNAEKNQYAYYLEGFEDNWIYSGNNRIANYTSVPPGDYIFRVKGSNNDGLWNDEGISIQITILPPFWQTWWAYLVYVLLFVAILYSIIHYYLRRQKLVHSLEIEHIEAEKLKELDKMKTKFFTNISHEFRTPLTLILGPAKQLVSKISNKADKQSLSVILKNANRLRVLVNQLLSLSKLDSGKMQLHAADTNLVPLVRGYTQSFESLAKQNEIKLLFDTETDTISAWVDAEKLEQILYNLLSNAFKFTKIGDSIEVSISQNLTDFSRLERGQKGVEIIVSDTGKGIPPDKLKSIFDRFYQVDDSLSRSSEGTGIGLAVVKELVSLHHGEIAVESKPGSGTTFTVMLPLGNDHLNPDEIVDKMLSDPSKMTSIAIEEVILIDSTVKNKQVNNGDNELPLMLIAEDNSDMRAYIRSYFDTEYQIIESEDGKEGMIRAFELIPDIIISDIMMPEMDGNEFCNRIKHDERTSHIPVILLTAKASKESRIEGLETGADDFITKPFDGEELIVRVNNLIEQRKKLSEYFRRDFELNQLITAEKPLSMDEKFMMKAKTVVEQNLTNPEYGVENFASDMALSRFQLHRKLSALVNQSITEFIRIMRLNFAIGLLKKRAGTISEIAYDAGFNNPTYFSISFKKQFGISPSEYVNQQEKSNPQ